VGHAEASGEKYINGAVASEANQLRQVGNLTKIAGKTDVETGRAQPLQLPGEDRPPRDRGPDLEEHQVRKQPPGRP
jgi:hypothetical protein